VWIVWNEIAAHEEAIVATLKPIRASIAAVWTEIRDLDQEQYTAFKNAKIEEIEILRSLRQWKGPPP
jgi:hypothetical protein